MNRKILQYPHLLLCKDIPPAPIEAMVSVACDLTDTLEVNGGLTLAAPQIGILKRVLAIRVAPDQSSKFPNAGLVREGYVVMFNPTLEKHGKPLPNDETCQSLAGYTLQVTRHTACTITYQNRGGEWCTVEVRGQLACHLQHAHEIIEGTYFIDHAGPLKKAIIEKKIKKAHDRAQQELVKDEYEAIKDLKGKHAADRFKQKMKRQRLAKKLASRKKR